MRRARLAGSTQQQSRWEPGGTFFSILKFARLIRAAELPFNRHERTAEGGEARGRHSPAHHPTCTSGGQPTRLGCISVELPLTRGTDFLEKNAEWERGQLLNDVWAMDRESYLTVATIIVQRSAWTRRRGVAATVGDQAEPKPPEAALPRRPRSRRPPRAPRDPPDPVRSVV